MQNSCLGISPKYLILRNAPDLMVSTSFLQILRPLTFLVPFYCYKERGLIAASNRIVSYPQKTLHGVLGQNTSKIRRKIKVTSHLTISMRGQRATGKIRRNKSYFSLDDS